ncbi:MAG: hypothetical protein JSR09_04890 [Bacteroidetes bacterium]|nr:hypothetical protein [Bacteroidota bacterium]MBS1649023.1 hypothetical protein [Bacteroidota bacterium]
MKQKIINRLAIILFVILFYTSANFAQESNSNQKGFWYEHISNNSKTIDFLFGFYPSYLTKSETQTGKKYTSVKCAIINKAQSEYKWDDYKVCILLKNGELIRSYTTVAETGLFACKYDIKSGDTHYQNFCFHTTFDVGDIDKIWVVLSDDEIIKLVYTSNSN